MPVWLWWLVGGLIVAGALVVFWDQIRNWLSTTVLDWVDNRYGYNARELIQRAVVSVDKVGTTVRRIASIFFTNARGYGVTYTDSVPLSSLPEEAQYQLENGPLEQTFELNSAAG